ncbi:MAG: TetR/AcrR family transcriptional regulator [Sphingopyxis sp.]|uniref:TetR/AcrR family transcriptional regulator n=1 Tax=Sphingopyxis sp. TaxID=1908224 RepID=UPI002ABCAFE2|nr:TetR/AcrR family transcriptional regulator [Sphingopyxis sp.]MDZ3833605.1 TetR/AcrR family transcriptional regulator [Sphingopyxis sp.]
MREVDEANTETRRRHIIEATTRCLARNGVAKTSMSDICREAGMRSGHIYYYFENKDTLLEAVLLRNRNEVIETIEHMLDGQDIASQIFDVHVKAEEGRLSYGLTPAVRIELECYFQRNQLLTTHRDEYSARLAAAMRTAVMSAIDAGRLPKDLDVDRFVNAIGLIWDGLSSSRLDPGANMASLRDAVHFLLERWLPDARPG